MISPVSGFIHKTVKPGETHRSCKLRDWRSNLSHGGHGNLNHRGHGGHREQHANVTAKRPHGTLRFSVTSVTSVVQIAVPWRPSRSFTPVPSASMPLVARL